MDFLIPKPDKYKPGIYIISNSINRRIYIGSAKNLRHRFVSHRNTLTRGCHKSPQLQSFVNKYGINCLSFGILRFCQCEELARIEQEFLDKIKPFGRNGFNTLTVAGSALGLEHSESAKLKISLAHKGRKHTESAKLNMKKGQQNRNWLMSEDHKKAVSAAHTGKKLSSETKALISKAHTGRVHSEEVRKRRSEQMKGKSLTEDQKKNQSIEMLERNPFGRLVLNTQTGIFYDSGIQAAEAHQMHSVGLNKKLSGIRKNNTDFILA